MLEFEPIGLQHRALLRSYLYPYGENSCQHAFHGLYCLREKYGSAVAECGGSLYICRRALETPDERCCLMPFGADARRALELLLEETHRCGKRLLLQTITQRSAAQLEALFPGRFAISEDRDYAEYLYTAEKLGGLAGPEMAAKRHCVSRFFRTFGAQFTEEALCEENIPEVLDYQAAWMRRRAEFTGERSCAELEREHAAIVESLGQFRALELSGIVARLGGAVCGYAYGARISEDCYDVLVEKGDRAVRDLYPVLNRDLVRRCCAGFAWVNREEDVGVPGLRKAKLSYKPDRLLRKYIARETGA